MIFGLTDTELWPYSLTKLDFFVFRLFFGACSLQNEVGDPPFFCLFGKSRSLPFCVASFKKICTWEHIGRERPQAKIVNSCSEDQVRACKKYYSPQSPFGFLPVSTQNVLQRRKKIHIVQLIKKLCRRKVCVHTECKAGVESY